MNQASPAVQDSAIVTYNWSSQQISSFKWGDGYNVRTLKQPTITHWRICVLNMFRNVRLTRWHGQFLVSALVHTAAARAVPGHTHGSNGASDHTVISSLWSCGCGVTEAKSTILFLVQAAMRAFCRTFTQYDGASQSSLFFHVFFGRFLVIHG